MPRRNTQQQGSLVLLNAFKLVLPILNIQHRVCVCACVGFFVWPVAVDITKMISDRGGGGVSHGWFAALYQVQVQDARGCQRVPARCPRAVKSPVVDAAIGVVGRTNPPPHAPMPKIGRLLDGN